MPFGNAPQRAEQGNQTPDPDFCSAADFGEAVPMRTPFTRCSRNPWQ
jgi:hypothetical protein